MAEGVRCHFIPVIKPSLTWDAMNFPKYTDGLEGGAD